MKYLQLKDYNFESCKNLCILHGYVFVMFIFFQVWTVTLISTSVTHPISVGTNIKTAQTWSDLTHVPVNQGTHWTQMVLHAKVGKLLLS